MANRIKLALASVAGAAILGGCATGPYYQDGYYPDQQAYGYPAEANGPAYPYPYDSPYYYGPGYYGPAYVGPTIGFGISYGTYWHGDRGHWHGNRDGDGRREWRGRGRSGD